VAFTVRATSSADGPALRLIERLAGERFREVGLAEVADAEPMAIDELSRYADSRRGWAAVDDHGVPIGYVLVSILDGNAHVEQLSVTPEWQRAGVGRALLDRIAGWARQRNLAMMTLTTFVDVPWNAPLYRHLGFAVLEESDIGPGLAARRVTEASHGLDPNRRVCMWLSLRPGPPAPVRDGT
jgi:GNAT superfamily N-acetyltransferase